MLLGQAAGSSTIDGTLGSADAGIVAAVYFTVSGTTPTIVGQKNVASVTRQSQGVYRITFTSALANNNYGIMLAARGATTTDHFPILVQPNRDSTGGNNTYSTTTVDIVCQTPKAASQPDPALCGVVVFDPAAVSASNYLAAASWTLSGTTLTMQRQTNVGSMSRLATGVYRTTFASALATSDYSEFAMSRYPDFTSVSSPIAGQNRNTTLPSNLHSTASLDLCTGRLNASSGNFEAGRGSVLVGRSDVAPRGTIARARFSVSGGVATLISSYNVSSITVGGTGLYRVNFTTPSSDSDYAVFASGKWGGSTDDDAPIIGADRFTGNLYSTAGVDLSAYNWNASIFDPEIVNVWVLKPWLM
jgi:hypothetical protein